MFRYSIWQPQLSPLPKVFFFSSSTNRKGWKKYENWNYTTLTWALSCSGSWRAATLVDEAATKSSRKMEFGGGTTGWKKTFFRVCRGRLVGISLFDGCFQHSKKPQMIKKNISALTDSKWRLTLEPLAGRKLFSECVTQCGCLVVIWLIDGCCQHNKKPLVPCGPSYDHMLLNPTHAAPPAGVHSRPQREMLRNVHKRGRRSD